MSQVDRTEGLVGNTAFKAPVRCATNSNITLSGEQTIDGLSVVTDDRVLVRSQTDASENGIWVCDTGDWNRSKDFDGSYDVVSGTQVYVTNGSSYGGTYWLISTANPITIGTTSITFTQALASDAATVSYTPSGTGGETGTTARRLGNEIWVQDFMTPTEKEDGYGTAATVDVTQSFLDAITKARARGNKTIYVESGRDYYLSDEILMHEGICWVAEGAQGSTQGRGCSITHYSNGNLFKWDGNGASAAGTGGGLRNFLCMKASGYNGGDLIKLLATNDSHRPGEMIFDNVLGYGLGTGSWARGLHVDGTACTTAGSKGVRSLHFRKVRFADTTTAGQTFYFNQAVHISGDIEVDQGSNGTNVGVTFAGDYENIHLQGVRIGGTLTINDPTTDTASNIVISGIVLGAIDNNNEDAVGVLTLATQAGINNASKNLRIICNAADNFSAYRDSSVANVTGDNTNYTVIFNAMLHDKNSSYDPFTGKFTAKCAGTYAFKARVGLTNLGAGHVRSDSAIVHRDISASPIAVYGGFENPYAQGANAGANFSQLLVAEIDMSEGETVEVQANVSGSTKTVSVYGAAITGGGSSYFMGVLK